MKTVAFKVLGCKVNSYEVEGIKHDFEKIGYKIYNDIDQMADVYVINTCTVTNTADKKSRQAIRKCIKKNPEAIIVVIGCYSQLKTSQTQDIEGVDIILGTQNRGDLIKHILQFEKERIPIVNVSNIMKQTKFETLDVIKFENKTRGFLKIQEGCNNFCTFCIIPWARGLIRSQDPKIVIDQAQKLVDSGILEIVLTGIHTGGYGEDLEDYTFVDLLYELEKITKLKRLRISSVEITQLKEEFLEYLKKSDKLVEHLHIPIQSGDGEILKLMKRNYTLEKFKNKIDEIRKIKPNIAISTDVIVGFPGESDESFENTCNTIKELKINNLHVFPYSKRNGTPAAKMENQVDEKVKKQRVAKLIEIGNDINYKYNKMFLNSEVEVLVENKNKEGIFEGYTSNYIKVKIIGDHDIQKNKIYKVKIVDVKKEEVCGYVIKDKLNTL